MKPMPTQTYSDTAVSEQEFQRLLAFIEADAGIRLPDTNHQIVRQFVAGRMQEARLGFDAYLAVLKQQEQQEYSRFLDAITINETYFFREQKHFQVLERLILPKLVRSGSPELVRSGSRALQIWSAACSTGEEAVSLMALAEHVSGAPTPAYSVMASDINPYALARCRAGEFTANAFREDGQTYHGLLRRVLTKTGSTWTLNADARERLGIRHINLFRDDLAPLAGRFDVIFLRNMLVYMPMPIRRKILDNLVPTLREGGLLFLASSEMPLISHAGLTLQEHDRVYFFHKKTLQEKRQGFSLDQRALQDSQASRSMAGQPRTPPVRQPAVPVTLDDVLLLANQKLHNRLFSAPENPNYAIALDCLRVVMCINEKKRAEAAFLARKIEKETGVNEMTRYFFGYLDMIEERAGPAMRLFRQALRHNREFWPARFYLAMLLRRTDSHAAAQEFAACRKSILTYIDHDRRDYQCLLEGFNAKYFLNMCQKFTQ